MTGGDDWRWRTFRRLNELKTPQAPGDEDLIFLLEHPNVSYDKLNDATRYWLARLAMSRQNLSSAAASARFNVPLASLMEYRGKREYFFGYEPGVFFNTMNAMKTAAAPPARTNFGEENFGGAKMSDISDSSPDKIAHKPNSKRRARGGVTVRGSRRLFRRGNR